METVINIEKEDIVTSRIGMNIKVKIDEKLSLVFTMEAIKELWDDAYAINQEMIADTEKIVESLRTARDISQLELFKDDGNDFDLNYPFTT